MGGRISRAVGIFLSAGTLLVAASAAAAPADDGQTCAKASGDVAIAACTRAIASGRYKGGDLAILHRNRGDGYNNKGDYDRAIADFNETIRLDPKDVHAYNNRGNAYQHKRDHDRAIADYNEVIRMNPKHAEAFNNRGRAYHNKLDYDRAIADLDEAIRLNPKYAVAYNNRGNAYQNKGDYDRAIADYNEALRLDPKYVLAYNGRGIAYRNKGDSDRAIAAFSEAIRLNPKYLLAYRNRGNVYRFKGDHDRAIADFDEAIRLDPKSAGTYFMRSRVYFYGGSLPKALADANQASELDPKGGFHALWLDIVGQRNGLPSRLAEQVTKIDMAVWPAPVIRMFMGQLTPAGVLAAADDPNATKKKNQICQVNFYSGALALRQNRKAEAVPLFRIAASECPHNLLERSDATAELKALGERL